MLVLCSHAGDLKNLVGRVVAIIGDGTVEVLPENLEGIKDPIPVPAAQLAKHFKVRMQLAASCSAFLHHDSHVQAAHRAGGNDVNRALKH